MTTLAQVDELRPEEARRIRELLYVLRHSEVFVKTDETYRAVKELCEVGAKAVPEVCRELERTTRDGALRVLAQVLRIAGDRRAVPVLIRALGRTAMYSSDCGTKLADRELWEYFNRHHYRKPENDRYPDFSIPRADREIVHALRKLTGTSVSEAESYVTAGEATSRKTEKDRARRARDIAQWEEWWEAHEEQEWGRASEVEGEDVVGEAGRARFGDPVPVGNRRLGPAREVVLGTGHYWDLRRGINFDTGRTYAYRERAPAPSALWGMESSDGSMDAYDYEAWVKAVGIDAIGMEHGVPMGKPGERIHMLRAVDLVAWPVANERWETLEEELATCKPLDLGQAGMKTLLLEPVVDWRSAEKVWRYPATFLFRTWKGGGGILQYLESMEKAVRFRYRMIEGTGAVRADGREEERQAGWRFGTVRQVVLESPARGKPAAMRLETGEVRAAPSRPTEYLGEVEMGWMKEWGGDVMVPPQRRGPLFALKGFDLRVCPVSEGAWEQLSADEAVAVVKRVLPALSDGQRFMTRTQEAPTPVFVMETERGVRAMLRIVEAGEKPQRMVVEYKLIERG